MMALCLQVVMSRLREDAADAGHIPFEIRALEALLMAVSMRMTSEATVIDQDSAKVRSLMGESLYHLPPCQPWTIAKT